MKTQIAYVHIGPASVNLLGGILTQMEKQSWDNTHILFAGHGVSAPALALPGVGQQPTPLYFLLFRKRFEEGTEMKPPVLSSGNGNILNFSKG